MRHAFNPRSIFYRPTAAAITRRTFSSKHLDETNLKAIGPTAEKLAGTGVWRDATKGSQKDNGKETKAKVKGDKTRVNVVSDELCDDVISYIGKTLRRHRGCDLIDIYPGAGVWSQKLHEFLDPRTHILMEPDEELYRPFLKPLLDRPNTKLIPASGLVWRELNSVLTPEHLPHQPAPDAANLNQRNDTLLVTANIAFHPRKGFRAFTSIAHLILYQLIDSIRNSGLFQRYGLVRMLIWARCDDIHGLIPKVMQKRKKLAVETELYCEWVREVCGRDVPESVWFLRDSLIDESSNLTTWRNMQAKKYMMPANRASAGLLEARRNAKSKKMLIPGAKPPEFKRPFLDVLDNLERTHATELFDKNSTQYKNMQTYRWRANWEAKKYQTMFEMMKEFDAIHKLYKSGKASPEEIEAREKAWQSHVDTHAKGLIQEFGTYKDNLHFYRQKPPVLHWDRREYEPLALEPGEFFPNIECSLLDIQPKSVHPLLRQLGPNSSRAGDIFEVLLNTLVGHGTIPISQALDALMPGAADYIIPRWTSARDLNHGGVMCKAKTAELTPRLLNARQWEQLLELWMEWPFRPEFHELVARTHDELGDEANIFASE
ncbi:S-adenosyl-L-methionine-dependent methyltransferase [Daldinia caldariorum]|uniref:S-adenosyl-L-methionine-dependent methyltransferase n=1 Tax=Daldinia caldariorum TaxID=326644 RepID=UPI002007A34E|nr:S-adenosyl-L-methionine-dependent methyltransferase [Daldinia caldariorum]KAI1462944.1 S-adenosyl-L-methionine-dependent methyltransferase [Daldinia caldariorum]